MKQLLFTIVFVLPLGLLPLVPRARAQEAQAQEEARREIEKAIAEGAKALEETARASQETYREVQEHLGPAREMALREAQEELRRQMADGRWAQAHDDESIAQQIAAATDRISEALAQVEKAKLGKALGETYRRLAQTEGQRTPRNLEDRIQALERRLGMEGGETGTLEERVGALERTAEERPPWRRAAEGYWVPEQVRRLRDLEKLKAERRAPRPRSLAEPKQRSATPPPRPRRAYDDLEIPPSEPPAVPEARSRSAAPEAIAPERRAEIETLMRRMREEMGKLRTEMERLREEMGTSRPRSPNAPPSPGNAEPAPPPSPGNAEAAPPPPGR